METVQTNLAAPTFIRSPNFDNLSVVGPGPVLPVATTAAAPAAPIVAAAAPITGAKKGASITSFFTDPKKRLILIAVVVLVALGVGLYLIHRSYQRRQRKVDEDEAAQEALASGQHQRNQQQQQQEQQVPFVSSPAPHVVSMPPGSQSDYERQMGTSLHEDQRRLQDLQFRQMQYQQQLAAAGQLPPELAHTAMPMQPPGPSAPGMLPNLNVNPAASGSGPGGAPIPGSPDDLGFTPV